MKDKNYATTSLLKRILLTCSAQVCFDRRFYAFYPSIRDGIPLNGIGKSQATVYALFPNFKLGLGKSEK